MKMIYLVRHGKAASMDSTTPDFKRPLTEKGKSDIIGVAERFKKYGIKPSLLITSPAVRALQTARICAQQVNYRQKNIRTRMALYDQGEDDLLNVVQAIADEHDTIMLIGHNPSITDFAQYLIKNFKKDTPTSGIIGIKLKTKSWKDISQGQGKLDLFDFPGQKTEPVSYKSLRKNLEKKLTEQIENVLEELDTGSMKKVKKPIRKSSRMIAKTFVKKNKRAKKK